MLYLDLSPFYIWDFEKGIWFVSGQYQRTQKLKSCITYFWSEPTTILGTILHICPSLPIVNKGGYACLMRLGTRIGPKLFSLCQTFILGIISFLLMSHFGRLSNTINASDGNKIHVHKSFTLGLSPNFVQLCICFTLPYPHCVAQHSCTRCIGLTFQIWGAGSVSWTCYGPANYRAPMGVRSFSVPTTIWKDQTRACRAHAHSYVQTREELMGCDKEIRE